MEHLNKYLAVSPEVPDAELVLRGARRSLGELGFVNAPATAQRIARACVDDTVDISYYDANRRALYEGLCAFGFKPVPGNGAFYLLVPAPDSDEQAFVERLADERLIVVAGSAFGCAGYVRLSYCLDAATIHAALPGFAAVARAYGLEPEQAEQTKSAQPDADRPGGAGFSQPIATKE